MLYYPGLQLGGNFGRGSYWYSAPDFWNCKARWPRTSGRHYIKVGGEYRRYRGNSSLPAPLQFFFPEANTANTYRESERTAERPSVGYVPARRHGRQFPRPQHARAAGTQSFLRLLLPGRLQSQPESHSQSRHCAGSTTRRSWIATTASRATLDLTNPIPEFQGANAPAAARAGDWRFEDRARLQRRMDPHRRFAPGAYNSPKNTFLPRFGHRLSPERPLLAALRLCPLRDPAVRGHRRRNQSQRRDSVPGLRPGYAGAADDPGNTGRALRESIPGQRRIR